MSPRLKREECLRTKHDSLFSKWKVLIGPFDWEDYSLGKDGVERYRIHNIPIQSACPGLYELGIASNSGGEDNRTRRHASEDVIVVYLGQADNVRTRLQQYGRAGAHLDHRNLITSADKIELPFAQTGPGLFREVFSRGCSIMFRWVPMASKKEAEKTEASLLEIFDYAWNKRGNGVCRLEEILLKLDNVATSPISSAYRKMQQWKQIVFDKKEGIKISGSIPVDQVGSSDGRKGFLPGVLKFVTFRPQLVQGGDGIPGDHDICGVAIGGGLVCRNKPVKGRKRCKEHKGKRITGIDKVTSREVATTSEKLPVCGFVSEDGSVCSDLAIHGRMRCELHKGRRIFEPPLHISSDNKLQSQRAQEAYDIDQEYNICGVVYGDGSICRKKPVSGQKRCKHHKGQRIAGTQLLTSKDWITKKESNLDEPYDICGVVTADASVCKRKPVSGRKRCEEHKGRRVTSPGLMISIESSTAASRSSSACGVTLSNGSICMKSPVPGRKRCSLHKGRRVS